MAPLNSVPSFLFPLAAQARGGATRTADICPSPEKEIKEEVETINQDLGTLSYMLVLMELSSGLKEFNAEIGEIIAVYMRGENILPRIQALSSKLDTLSALPDQLSKEYQAIFRDPKNGGKRIQTTMNALLKDLSEENIKTDSALKELKRGLSPETKLKLGTAPLTAEHLQAVKDNLTRKLEKLCRGVEVKKVSPASTKPGKWVKVEIDGKFLKRVKRVRASETVDLKITENNGETLTIEPFELQGGEPGGWIPIQLFGEGNEVLGTEAIKIVERNWAEGISALAREKNVSVKVRTAPSTTFDEEETAPVHLYPAAVEPGFMVKAALGNSENTDPTDDYTPVLTVDVVTPSKKEIRRFEAMVRGQLLYNTSHHAGGELGGLLRAHLVPKRFFMDLYADGGFDYYNREYPNPRFYNGLSPHLTAGVGVGLLDAAGSDRLTLELSPEFQLAYFDYTDETWGLPFDGWKPAFWLKLQGKAVSKYIEAMGYAAVSPVGGIEVPTSESGISPISPGPRMIREFESTAGSWKAGVTARFPTFFIRDITFLMHEDKQGDRPSNWGFSPIVGIEPGKEWGRFEGGFVHEENINPFANPFLATPGTRTGWSLSYTPGEEHFEAFTVDLGLDRFGYQQRKDNQLEDRYFLRGKFGLTIEFTRLFR